MHGLTDAVLGPETMCQCWEVRPTAAAADAFVLVFVCWFWMMMEVRIRTGCLRGLFLT